MDVDERLLLPKFLIAQAFGISPQAFDGWRRKGLKPHSKSGREQLYYLPEVIAWFKRQHESKDESGLFKNEKDRLDSIRAEMVEFDLAVKKENYISKNALADILGRVLTAFRNRMLSLPTKLAPQIMGKKKLPEIREILSKAVNECLNELSGFKARGLIGGNGHRDNGKAAAKANGKRVGGRKKTTKH